MEGAVAKVHHLPFPTTPWSCTPPRSRPADTWSAFGRSFCSKLGFTRIPGFQRALGSDLGRFIALADDLLFERAAISHQLDGMELADLTRPSCSLLQFLAFTGVC